MLQLYQKEILLKQVPGVLEVKKIVSVSTTFTLMADARDEVLERVPYIHYPVQFKSTNGTQV